MPNMSDERAIAPLVSADWLAERNGAPNLLVLDIRSAVDGGGRAAFEQAHIPARSIPIMPRTAGGRRREWRRAASRRGRPQSSFCAVRIVAVRSCGDRFGGNERGRFLRRGAGLLDAQDRRPRDDVDPRRRHAGLAGRSGASAGSGGRGVREGCARLSGDARAEPSLGRRCGRTHNRERRTLFCSTRAPRHFSKASASRRKPCVPDGFQAQCISTMCWSSTTRPSA